MAAVAVVLYLFYEHISQFCRNALTKHSESFSLSTTYFSHSHFVIHKPGKTGWVPEEFAKRKKHEQTGLSYFRKIYVSLFRRHFLSLFSHISLTSKCWWTRRKPLQHELKDRGGLEKRRDLRDANFRQFSSFNISRVLSNLYSVDLNKLSVLKL